MRIELESSKKGQKTSSGKQKWASVARQTPESCRLVWISLLGFGLESARYGLFYKMLKLHTFRLDLINSDIYYSHEGDG